MSRENIAHDLKRITASKSLMLCTLLWLATSLPIFYLDLNMIEDFPLVLSALLSFGITYSYLLPICYLAFSFEHRCPHCKSAYCYINDEDKIIGVKYIASEDDKVKSREERVLHRKKCTVCGYIKLTPKTKLIREST